MAPWPPLRTATGGGVAVPKIDEKRSRQRLGRHSQNYAKGVNAKATTNGFVYFLHIGQGVWEGVLPLPSEKTRNTNYDAVSGRSV